MNTGLYASKGQKIEDKQDKAEAIYEMRKVLRGIYLDPTNETLWEKKRELKARLNPLND